MRYRILDLAFCPRRKAIDDEPLQRLLHGHEVLGATERFYVHEGTPHLLVSVRYRLARLDPPPERAPPAARRPAADGKAAGEHWRDILEEKNHALFETLRAWRTARARAEAVPPYVLLTNAQLARVANRRPATLKDLREVPGLGDGRLERFGRELLEVIASGAVPAAMETRGDSRRNPS